MDEGSDPEQWRQEWKKLLLEDRWLLQGEKPFYCHFFIILKCKKNILLHVYIREECIKKHGGYVEEQMVKKIFILISYILFHILHIFGVHTESTGGSDIMAHQPVWMK